MRPIANKLDLGRWGELAKAMAQGEEILGSQGLWGSEVLRHQKPGIGNRWGLETACGTLFSQTSQEPGVFLGLQGKKK